MSLKDNIDMVKEELNSEEKFFEKAVMTEKFVKKYKNVMIGSLVAVVAVVVANIAYESNKDSLILNANEALTTLSKNASNEQALADLKESSRNLYDVWMFSKAVADKDVAALNELKSSSAALVSDLAAYESAQAAKDVKSLEEYALKQDSIYKDLALVQSAVMLINDGKVEEARKKLSMVSDQSSLAKISQALLHYGVK